MTVRASRWLIVLAAVCFGTTGTAQALGALGGAQASATSLGAARIVFGGALLTILAFAVALAERRRRSAGADRDGDSDREPGRVRGRLRGSSVALVLLGAAGVAAYQPAFFTGTAQNGVAVGTLVALGSAPVLTGLLEWGWFRRPPGIRWACATFVAATGVAALSGLYSGGGGPVTALGIAGSLGAAASYAVYTLSTKLLLDRGWSPTTAMGATFGTAAVLMLPVLLASNPAWLAQPAGLATAAWLAVVTTALAYTLFARGLRGLPASQVSTLTLVEPVTATALGIFLLHEDFTPATICGILLLVTGLAILTVPRRMPVRAG
ncbi:MULTISPECIES: DMT family transporter [unclassified Cryobacterium]|uniref:DMT family transporter n=1 Tax=unclassified Cryobacterium TaxID=2649013 RepID=UPI002AB3A7E6|nr:MULTISPECIES: EamA family transporter [unclassified Cryobacterium]MDY7529345.1 EamA family transporter [Cryobacterium sp. 10C2]MDY7558501.1 EamA family transporter [Cryobacterium sp. 10C3]MEB0290213.1 EamA family transporter [Cryobacterium sp. 10C2]